MSDEVTGISTNQTVTDTTPQNTASVNLSDITNTKLIVDSGETFTVENNESIVRTEAIIDGELTVNGELELTQ